jgi:hypothetical protein
MAYEDRRITGSTSGSTVWGSNPYTDDSDFSVAAVHAGLVLPGETKYIRLTEVGELTGYTGTTKNGVTTKAWDTPWNGLYITLVGEFPSDGSGSSYGYDDWYEEFSGSLLKGINKTEALRIGQLIATFYSGDSKVTDDVGNTWYALFRKPDAEGLAYWTREAYLSYNRNPFNLTFARFFFSSSKPGDLDYNRTRTASKSFLSGNGVGDFYDRGSSAQSSVIQSITSGLSIQEARQVVLDLYASIGRGPTFGTKLSEIDQAGYDFWVNKIVNDSLTVAQANTQFTADVNNFIANNPEDPYTRYVLSWRATQEAGPPAPPVVQPPTITREVEPIQSTYVPSADGSTRVMWAGIKSGVGLVSIFNNPKNSQGDDSPLNSPLSNLNRIFFDTRFNYLNIVSEANPTINFPFRDINKQNTGKKGKDTRLIPVEGEALYTAYPHNLGYVPSGLLYDLDNNQALSGNTFLQNIDNTSFRLVYLLVDDTNFYIKERFFVRGFPLPSLSKSFRILVFNNPAGVV